MANRSRFLNKYISDFFVWNFQNFFRNFCRHHSCGRGTSACQLGPSLPQRWPQTLIYVFGPLTRVFKSLKCVSNSSQTFPEPVPNSSRSSSEPGCPESVQYAQNTFKNSTHPHSKHTKSTQILWIHIDTYGSAFLSLTVFFLNGFLPKKSNHCALVCEGRPTNPPSRTTKPLLRPSPSEEATAPPHEAIIPVPTLMLRVKLFCDREAWCIGRNAQIHLKAILNTFRH